MKKTFAVAGVLLLGGCALTPRTDAVSLQKYDAIYDCAGDDNPVRANCGGRFKDTELSGQLSEIHVNGAGTELFLLMRGDQYYVSCSLPGAADRDQVASMNRGDAVTIRGTPVARRFDHDLVNRTSSATIVFDPCTLVGVKQRAAAR